MINFIFGMQINIKVFYKLILPFWVCVARHAQSTKNKFVYLAISPEKHGDEVDFLSADKHESSPQIDTMILMGMVKHSQSSQNSKFAMFLQYLKEEVRDELDFLHANKHQSFLQVDFSTLVIKVSYKVILLLLMSIINHSESTQSNKFVMFLQYLKKQFILFNGVHFLHADKHQSFDKLALLFLMKAKYRK